MLAALIRNVQGHQSSLETVPRRIQARKWHRCRAEFDGTRYRGYIRLAGTFPPFAASLAITCLCSQMFIVAESFVSPV